MKNSTITFKRIFALTIKHIKRNKWLSIASILVITFSFLISTIFIILGIGSNEGLSALEKQGQILVFFELDASEREILKVKDKIVATGLTEKVDYISKEMAQQQYVKDFKEDVQLVESLTTGALPPSLEIRVRDINTIDQLLKFVANEKEKNRNINEVVYYKDFIDRLRTAVNFGRYSGAALIIFFAITSITLILITISFNIKIHQDEIKTMKLIGGTSWYIKAPYVIEGAIYGLIGATISCFVISIVWFGGLYLIKQTDLYFLLSEILKELNLLHLIDINFLTIIIFLLLEISAGIIVGVFSSFIAVLRYIKNEN